MAQPSSDQPPIVESSYIFDSESSVEMGRLTHQGQLLTRAMGGTLANIDPAAIAQWRQVIDIGCGPGDWVLDVAFEQPQIEVAGIDISRLMVDYANARARSQQLINASFEVMDIREPLDFPDATFDMVNARFLCAVLKREQWPIFLKECLRILRPGGLLRLTEPIDLGASSSPALELTSMWFCQLLRQNGYCFSTDGNTVGLTHKLPRLMRDVGYQDIRQTGHCLDVSSDMHAWLAYYRNSEVASVATVPLLVQAGIASQAEVEEQLQKMLIEMHSEDFCGVWHYVSIQGIRASL